MSASTITRLAALAVLATACAPRQAAPPRPDENAIRTALNAELAKFPPAAAAKDTAALANLFTQDATWILPDASTFTDHANIVAGAKALFGTFESMTISQIVIDKLVVVSDSEAVTFSHGNYTMTVRGKRPESRVNPFADLWKKGADGTWRVVYEVNADGPAAPAAPATAPKH
jgi:uncharacterized protein (TIGR02246 family)